METSSVSVDQLPDSTQLELQTPLTAIAEPRVDLLAGPETADSREAHDQKRGADGHGSHDRQSGERPGAYGRPTLLACLSALQLASCCHRFIREEASRACERRTVLRIAPHAEGATLAPP